MPLSAGDRLGHYEVLSLLGEGGMGEVYRAKDTKLDRDVAIKVLPQVLAHDPERLARFEREAKVLASLDHPNIGQIHGIVDFEDSRGLVLALIDGPTLADRIKTGPIPLDEAIAIAKQIVEALEYAHDRGVVHRDLKPANVKITSAGFIKVLDFGLAKVLEDEPPASSLTNSPTLTMRDTRAGIILGTAAYMSPEQAVGRPVDRRSDIFSFGAVLYEMLTGKRAFNGPATPDLLEAVVKLDPDWTALPAGTPGYVRRLLERTLAKDRKQRLQAIGEARIVLEYTGGDEMAAPGPGLAAKSKLPWLVAALALGAILLGVGWWRAARPADHSSMRLSVDLGSDALAGNRTTVAISPDGTRIAFPVSTPGGTQQLATRLLDQPTATPLAGTENGADPFFSPDGQWIGFAADGKLKKISVLGGAAITLCDAPNPRGASWAGDGSIVASLTNTAGLSRVPGTGGTPRTLTKVPDKGDLSHRWPEVLPGGDAALFSGSISPTSWDDGNIEVLSLKTGETKILLQGGYFPRYVPTGVSTGHLVYIHSGALLAVPFDPVRLEVRGTPVPLLEDVAGHTPTGGGQFDYSRANSTPGVLVYLSSSSRPQTWPVVWLDGSGKTERLLPKPGVYHWLSFSPDGNRLALSAEANGGQDIYVYDWQHENMPRLTSTGRANVSPVWTPDGKHIAFSSSDGLWWVRADGAGGLQRLLESKKQLFPDSFSPDGGRLVYRVRDSETLSDIWTLPLDNSDPEHPKPGMPEQFLHTPADESWGMLSPDGGWMAYVSNETGRGELYVRPFPGPGGKSQISAGGGQMPAWSRNGRELFYATLDNRIMVTEYTAKGDSFDYSKPHVWYDKQLLSPGTRFFALAPDGKRLAVFPRPEASDAKQGNVHVTFLLNFFDELRRKVPTGK